MALIKCPKCGNDVSDKATECPKCGKIIQTNIENKANMSDLVCPECGNVIDEIAGQCTNCGYNPNKVAKAKKQKTKKIILSVACVLVVGLIATAIFFIINANKENGYVVDACEELANNQGNLPDIKAIYTSDEVDDGSSTINYIYRVYIEYSSRWLTNKVIYIVDNKGRRYFITEDSSKKLNCYIGTANLEIFGIKGLIKPTDKWKEMSESEISKVEKKIKE